MNMGRIRLEVLLIIYSINSKRNEGANSFGDPLSSIPEKEDWI
jgi:hypothetical protein